MKLLQEIQLNAAGLKTDFSLIRAGGPGSGRHPGFGKMVKSANKLGFKGTLHDRGTGALAQTVYKGIHPTTHHELTISKGFDNENFWRLKDGGGQNVMEHSLPVSHEAHQIHHNMIQNELDDPTDNEGVYRPIEKNRLPSDPKGPAKPSKGTPGDKLNSPGYF